MKSQHTHRRRGLLLLIKMWAVEAWHSATITQMRVIRIYEASLNRKISGASAPACAGLRARGVLVWGLSNDGQTHPGCGCTKAMRSRRLGNCAPSGPSTSRQAKPCTWAQISAAPASGPGWGWISGTSFISGA